MLELLLDFLSAMFRLQRNLINRRFDSVDRQLDEIRGAVEGIDPTAGLNRQVIAMLETERARAERLDQLQTKEPITLD